MRQRAVWVTLGVLLTAALFCFAYPMYVIRPFRAQGASELAVALVVRQWGPSIAIAAAVGSLACVAVMWRGFRSRWAKSGAVLLSLLTVAGAALARVNVYELMFHPVGAPGFGPAATAKVDNEDMVLAVALNGDSHAWPIRAIAYHHIVNDVVGREPIVSTY